MNATSGKEIRVEMRLRNNRLWNLIYPRWDSVNTFCKDAGFYGTEVGLLLNLKKYPLLQDGMYCLTCRRLAEYFRILVEDLFPLEIYVLEKTEGTVEIGPEQIPFHECALLPAPDMMESLIEEIDRKELTEELLCLVHPRERRYLEMMCGLGEFSPHTLQEIADLDCITRPAVNQVVQRAIRRIQSHSIVKTAYRSMRYG